MNCPYCQSNIKSDTEVQYCKECGTPHHRECWEENGGCTTYGCGQNPLTKKDKINIGNLTIEQITEFNKVENVSSYGECIYCGGKIENDSVYCKHCGKKLAGEIPEVRSDEFLKEYESRYKTKIKKRRIKYFVMTATIAAVSIILILISYFAYIYVTKNYFSEEAKILRFVNRWEKAWESKNPDKYEKLLDRDYLYIDKSGEKINREERLKRINLSFKNLNKIELELNNIEIAFDSTDYNYVNVKFLQKYISEKINEEGVKTLRLYRGEDTGGEWKIYREYFESIKN